MELDEAQIQTGKKHDKAGGPIRINLKRESNNIEPSAAARPPASNIDMEVSPTTDVVAPVPIPETSQFVYFSTGEDPIEITNKNPKTLENCSTYDAELNKIGLFWDMLIVI